MKNLLRNLIVLASLALLAGCATEQSGNDHLSARRAVMLEAIHQEPPGNYYIGYRYYKQAYKMWGYVRKPGQTWDQAKLVMLNENKKLAPDRAGGKLGSDIGDTYRLTGYYSGQTVYEPASNGFYPEFVLTGYNLISTTQPPIFHTAVATDPTNNYIAKPY